MQTSSLPKRIPTPFADSGSKQDIPVASQIGITGGRASYTDGFPPLTRTPLSAGGIPPFGTDFNGVLNDVTAAIRWDNAGAGYPFDATFATSIAGYPKGAVIPNSLGDGYWLNITDANTSNPEVSTGALTGWVPYETYGVTSITGLASSSVTLTSLQAAKDRIKLAGALTSNINIVVPAWIKKWTIVNNCTGSFTVTVKTPSGTGIAIPTGLTANVVGDGTNISQDTSLLGPAGRLNGAPVVITASGTYTPKSGTNSILVYVLGGGGGGGGTPATGSSSASAGGGGGGGGIAVGYFTSGFSGAAVTIGSGGTGNSAAAGSSGGVTSFGSLLSASGGSPGAVGGLTSTPYFYSNGQGGSTFTGSALYTKKGQPGTIGQVFTATVSLGGSGGGSDYGQGGNNGGATAGNQYAFGQPGSGYGAGGGGAVAATGSPVTQGGNGTAGVIIVWEFT